MNAVEHINAALLALARLPISGLEDNTAEAQVAGRLYETAYAEALSGYRWSFARATTAQLSKSPLPTEDDLDVYPLPAGWFSLVRVFEGPNGGDVPFRLEGNSLVTLYDVQDSSGLFVTYTRRPDEGALPPYFSPYFVAVLAAWFAMPLTENATIQQTWEAKAIRLKRDALFADASSSGRKTVTKIGQLSVLAGR